MQLYRKIGKVRVLVSKIDGKWRQRVAAVLVSYFFKPHYQEESRMRVRQVICHMVAVAALGAVCMAQSATGSGTQSTDQQSPDQQRMEQQNNENTAPSNTNGNDGDVSRTNPDNAGSSTNNADTGDNKTNDRAREIENANKLTETLQKGTE
jgi:hypothetical protein